MTNSTIEPSALAPKLPRTHELLNIARRLIWWMPPEEALEEPSLFLAQVMTLGTWDDVELVRAALGEEPLRECLHNAPPGIFDLPSWHYWHRRFGIQPIPPPPRRKLL
jgi:hypothetical protein